MGKVLSILPRTSLHLLDYHNMFGGSPDFGKISVSLNPDSSVGKIDFENDISFTTV